MLCHYSSVQTNIINHRPNTPPAPLPPLQGHVARTFYAKELAARLVLASVARAAARANKGIDVLCAVAIRSFITVMVRHPRLVEFVVLRFNLNYRGGIVMSFVPL